MYLVRMIVFGAALSLVFEAGQAAAQEKSFKEAIIGPWIITAVFDEYQSGEKKDNWGGPVKGQLTFGRTGRFTTIIIGPAVSSMKTDDPRKPDAPVVAYYGRANMETVWTVQGSGDKLTLIGSPRKDQHGTFSPKLEVRRP